MKIKIPGVRKITITGEFISLQQLLKLSGIAATGGEAKIMIQDGAAHVNGECVLQRGKKLRPGDVVRCLDTVLVVSA